jgi:DNA-3-methyladenine glycosylase I
MPAPPSDDSSDLIRCTWVAGRRAGDLMLRYHDEEWGVPQHDDRALFELLTLEGAQAGLSWETVLKRREGYRRTFEGFDIARIAGYGAAERERLLADAGIIRNGAKIDATIGNARAALGVIETDGSLDAFLWRFVGGRALQHSFASLSDVPASDEVAKTMGKELQRRGFRFVGPTICYAFMQAAGLVNDHLIDCFRYAQLTPAVPDASTS